MEVRAEDKAAGPYRSEDSGTATSFVATVCETQSQRTEVAEQWPSKGPRREHGQRLRNPSMTSRPRFSRARALTTSLGHKRAPHLEWLERWLTLLASGTSFAWQRLAN